MSNLIYDEYYNLTLSNNAYDFSNFKGAFAGNGKIALYNSMNKIGTDQIVISVGEATFDQVGRYKNNVIEGFSMNDIKLFTYEDNSNITYTMQSQSLNMINGSCTTTFEVSSNNILNFAVESTITPLRQYPYCVLQSLSFTPNSNLQSLDIYHMMRPHEKLTNIEYNNNTFFNDKIYADKGLYIMNAKAFTPELNSTLSCASCYFDNSNILGFNVLNKKEACYQQMRYNFLLDGITTTFHILTILMTSNDFPDPVDEVKRILMNVAFKNEDTDNLITTLNNDNGTAWYQMWSSDIELRPKEEATIEERDRVIRVSRYIRQSIYNIFCCVREGINSEVNPLSLSYVDTNGNLFYDSDIWLLPTLLLLKPQVARTLLEFRYKGLEQATQLAASFGLKGSKYPYQNDVVGYKNLYWDVASPLHIFNNAVIAINTWNYYRLTIDKEWLINKGYIIMKNVADFLVSNIDSSRNMNNIIGLGGRISTNHAFTKYATRLALKYTIEASYELNYIPKQLWLDNYLNMDVSYYSGQNYDVIKYDSTFTNSEELNILDNLLIFLPYYSYLYFNNNNNPVRDHNSVRRNIEYYINTISADFLDNPLNNILKTAIYGLIAQSDTSYLSTFYNELDNIIDTNGQHDYWGHLVTDIKNGVDININGLYLFMILTIMGGFHIKGGITEGKFYYEAYGLCNCFSTNMPETWNNIVFSAIGNNQELFNILNNIPYGGG